MKKKCLFCKKIFYKRITTSIRNWKCEVKYCSRKCKYNFSVGRPPWNKGRKLHYDVWNKGKKTGQKVWNKGVCGKQKWMNLSGLKMGRGYFKGKHNNKIMGDNHWNWKGGNSTERHNDMGTLEYKLWRTAVFERDEYACIKCRSNKSGSLEADHIKPWAVFPELRYAIDNGQTLCENCHFLKTKADRIIYFNQKYMEVN